MLTRLTRTSGRTLGQYGPVVSALGLGTAAMSDSSSFGHEAESIATIRAALDSGVTLIDTADFYGMGHNELLIRDALQGRARDQVILSVKTGSMRDPDGAWLGGDGRPAAIKNFLAYTLRRLGTDYVDIYRPARLDPAVPIEDTIGAIADMVKAGHVRYIGLSEVGAETIRRAQAVHPIADLQIEYSLFSRSPEYEVLPTCRELGIGVTAYGVLSHGLLSGHWSKERTKASDFTRIAPRFSDANLAHNLALVDALRAIADEKGATVAQLAIAWVLAQGEHIVPLVGARHIESLNDSLKASDLTLTPADLARIEQAIPAGAAAGERYPVPLMRLLDSERGQGKK